MSLTNISIQSATPSEKPYKLTDGKGLYLLVNKTGKYFRWDYRFAGKRKTMALGVYTDTSLKQAREDHEDGRRLLTNGIDPMEERKRVNQQEYISKSNSFEFVARDWFSKKKPGWTEKHSQTVISRLENNVFPIIGKESINEIPPPRLLEVLRIIEERGAIETAHRVKQICGQIFRYAIAIGRAERDPSADLKGALTSVRSKHMAAITEPSKVGELLRAILGYQGNIITRCALRLAPLVFVRPGELRHAEWDEVNFEKSEWKIPAVKMKMRLAHMVPLSEQAVRVLEEIKPFTRNGVYVFPSLRTGSRPMSNNTVNAALRRLGFSKEEMTGHGFRSMASTLLHENGWRSDLIERQLAHVEGNSVKAAYNHAQHLPERREMMQWWANYLDELIVTK